MITASLAFLTLVLIFLALPALFLLANIPSFEMGQGFYWILRWRNDSEGSGISFNLLPPLVIALGIGAMVSFTRPRLGR